VTDIFFSYRSVDRERVRPVHDAFAKQGFEVFWDQEVPSGVDWDTWIRQHLTKAKCAVVFWSAASVESDNVRHEAAVAKRQGKLITVLLEPLSLDQFPMGLYSQQAINLTNWKGDFDDAEWHKLNRDIEAKLTPPWMQQRIFELEAELVAERARREGAENRARVLQAQIAKEVQIQQDLERERDRAVDAATALENVVSQSAVAQSAAERRAADLSIQFDTVIMQPKSRPREDATSTQIRKLGPGNVPFAGHRAALLFAIVAGFGILGVWALWDGRATSPKSPVLSQAKSPPAVLPQIQSPPSMRSAATSSTGLFDVRSDTEAFGDATPAIFLNSMPECEQSCQKSASCKIYTYNKDNRICYLYRNAELRPSTFYNTGLRK